MYFPVANPSSQPPAPTIPTAQAPAWWACAGMSFSFEVMYLIVYLVLAITALLCQCLLAESVLLGLGFLALILGLRTSCLLILAFVAIFTYNNWDTLSEFTKNIS